MFRNLWRRWLKSLRRAAWRGRLAPSKSARRQALALQHLEDRTVPGTFNAPLITNLPDSPDAVATGHFRGPNSPLDVVTINRHGTVSVLLGNSDGTFQSPLNISVDGSSFTHSLAVGDLLGNGVQDIVTSNGTTVQVLLGNGDGTFQSPQTVETVPLGVGGVALGDFLGNGRQDILTVEHGRVSVLLSNGDGTFQAPVDTPISGVEFNHFRQVAVGDFNHDGKPGLAVAASNGIEVLRGNGDGTFSLETTISLGTATYVGIFPNPVHVPIGATEVRTADLLGNGQTDLVAVTNDDVIPAPTTDVRVLLGNGDGTFQAPVTLREPVFGLTTEGAFDYVNHVAVGDFTGHGNGQLDIATLNFGTAFAGSASGFINAPNFDVWVNNGDGTFHNLRAKPIGGGDFFQAAGDFRGDGKLDLLALGNKSATVFLGNGDGTFNLAPTFATNGGSSVVAADFTGSGRPKDLLVGSSVLLGNGDGTFRAPVTAFSIPSNDEVIGGPAVGDFLGNGKQDIAVALSDIATGQNSVLIFLGNGDGTFQRMPLTLTLPSGFINTIQSLAARDLDGDGKADLIVTSTQESFTQQSVSFTGVVSVFLSNGDGTFQSPENFNVGTAVSDLTVADLRGDGKLDLIATTPVAGGQSAVEVLFGNGDGTFQSPVTVFTGTGDKLAVGEFLNNGRQDIVTFTRNGTLSLLVNNGDGTFGSPITTQTGVSLGQVAVGDFVGNGHLGLAFTATDAGGVAVLQGNGDGTFQVAGEFLTGPRGPLGLVSGDFNGDGKLDLIVGDSEIGGFGTATITVLLNQGTAAPPTLQGVQVNDGSGQDPAARSLTVTFSTTVTLGDGALEIQDSSGHDVAFSVTTAVVNGRTVATVTFSGALPTASYTLIVHSALVHDSQGQALALVNGSDPSFSFTSTVAQATTVTSVLLNDGDPTSAPVRSITVHFSGQVTLDAGAFELLAQGAGDLGLSVTVTSDGSGNTVAEITFGGAALADGAYSLVIHGGLIHDGQGQALGGGFAGDNAADFASPEASGLTELVGLFHPVTV
jgi:hypothetical protein